MYLAMVTLGQLLNLRLSFWNCQTAIMYCAHPRDACEEDLFPITYTRGCGVWMAANDRSSHNNVNSQGVQYKDRNPANWYRLARCLEKLLGKLYFLSVSPEKSQ